ncbi:hypothetical protein ACFXPM_31025 [Streptomyces sp. NPDC059095]|uniref:hypothetical protein n=1 Tax=Streptomyces sp. NPDC059095 TaxID=3346726 RepID=UPI0036B6A596
MTDKKPQPSSPQAPPLTEQQRVSRQVGVTDTTTEASQALAGMFPFGGSPRFFGTTDFESHRLNELIDLVEHAKPEHLTSAGEALFAAREAIHEAAGALGKDIARVAWEGQAGNAFRDWGKNLANHASDLADFAGTAAAQISAAGTGLASVRQAMPPRDLRAEPVRATDLPAMKRVAGNAEYEAAVRVEKDRQEAINQMNRLSSFYTVSEQTLAAQQPPVFQSMPVVGVPQPEPGFGNEPRESDRPTPLSPSVDRTRIVHHPDERSSQPQSQVQNLADRAGRFEHQVATSASSAAFPIEPPTRTELNSVVAPSVPTSAPAVASQPPSVPEAPPAVSGLPSVLGESLMPVTGGAARALGPAGSGFREPVHSVAGPSAASGRGVATPLGRAGGPSPNEVQGGGRAKGEMPMARGVAGGSPRFGEMSGPRGGTTSPMAAGRGGGVVGGRPTAASPGSAASRSPRGAVVGGEGAASSSQARRSIQRGVIGATRPSPANGAPSISNADGVVGKPQGRTSGARAARNGFSRGGTGLVGRVRGDRDRNSEDQRTDQDGDPAGEAEESSL